MNLKNYALSAVSLTMIAVPVVSGFNMLSAHAASVDYTITDNNSSFSDTNKDKVVGNVGDAPVFSQKVTSVSDKDQVLTLDFSSMDKSVKVSCVDDTNTVVASGLVSSPVSFDLKAGKTVTCTENQDGAYVLSSTDFKSGADFTKVVKVSSNLVKDASSNFDASVKMAKVSSGKVVMTSSIVVPSKVNDPTAKSLAVTGDVNVGSDTSNVVSYNPGDTVTATYDISNSSDYDVNVTANYVLDGSGNKVDLTDYNCVLSDGSSWDMSMAISSGQSIKCFVKFVAPNAPQTYTYSVVTEWQDITGVGTPAKSDITFAVNDPNAPAPTPTPTPTPEPSPSPSDPGTPSPSPSPSDPSTPSPSPSNPSTPGDSSSPSNPSTPGNSDNSPGLGGTDNGSNSSDSSSSSGSTSSGNSGSSSSNSGSTSTGSSNGSTGSGSGSNVKVNTGGASTTQDVSGLVAGSAMMITGLGYFANRFVKAKINK